MTTPTPAQIADFNLAMFNLSVQQRTVLGSVNQNGMGGAGAFATDLVVATTKLQTAAAALT